MQNSLIMCQNIIALFQTAKEEKNVHPPFGKAQDKLPRNLVTSYIKK
jgi:hypothetical protein